MRNINKKLRCLSRFQEINTYKSIFLIYNTTDRSSPKSAQRYRLEELMFDCMDNIKSLFPTITNNEFKKLWEKLLKHYEVCQINIFEDLNAEFRRKLYRRYFKEKIENFILNKLRELEKEKKDQIFRILESVPKRTRMKWVEKLNKDEKNLLNSLALLYKGEYYKTNDTYMGPEYYRPFYFDKILPILRKMEKGKLKLRIDADDIELAKD